MNKQIRFKNVLDNFFTSRTLSLNGLVKMLKDANIVLGELAYQTEKKENGHWKLTIIDNDKYQYAITSDGLVTETDIDMSVAVLTFHLNESNVIECIEHGFSMFTPANKDTVLVVASFIGKTIMYSLRE